MLLTRLVVPVFSIKDLCIKGHQVPALTQLDDLDPWYGQAQFLPAGDSVDSHCSGSKNVATTFGSASIFPLRFVHQRASGPV